MLSLCANPSFTQMRASSEAMLVPGTTPQRPTVGVLFDSPADPLGVLDANEIFFASSQPLDGEVLVSQASADVAIAHEFCIAAVPQPRAIANRGAS